VKTPLPVVVVNIPDPCRRRWAGLSGNDRVRFCGDCGKSVYNLSAMTAPQAAAFVASNPVACVAYNPDDDGNVATLEYAPRASQSRRRWWWLGAGVVASLACAVAQVVFGAKPALRPAPMMMGAMPPPQVTVMGNLPSTDQRDAGEPDVKPPCEATK